MYLQLRFESIQTFDAIDANWQFVPGVGV